MARANDDRHTLTAERLAHLLARLHANPHEAGQEYERLRRTLMKFFDWRGVWPADECADECLDRLARRLDEDVPIIDIRQFAHGIARLVLLERRRRPAVVSIDRLAEAAAPAIAPAETGPSLHDCFDRCLAEMPDDQRALIVGYYEGDRDRKIANRRRLSAAMGLSENALRSRVQRLRDRLEACIRGCVPSADRGGS
jgi:DNA-directed RNA polymerase specialized sigma24 family protein